MDALDHSGVKGDRYSAKPFALLILDKLFDLRYTFILASITAFYRFLIMNEREAL
jgi:hypothetical protein